MSEQLDQYFPLFVFSYGILMLVAQEFGPMAKYVAQAFRSQKSLAWICFFVGGLWTAQNIWLGLLF